MAFEVNYERTRNGLDVKFDDIDCKNTVDYAMRQFTPGNITADRLVKRDELMQFVHGIGAPHNYGDNIGRFVEADWFGSMPMWLDIQAAIDRYHTWAEANGAVVIQYIELPKIKNLSVVPICSHMRKPVKIDADVIYRMMCDTQIIPRDEFGRQVSVGEITRNKEFYFEQIFNMEYINSILNAKKQFHHYILCDGVSASIHYKVKKGDLEKLVDDGIIRKRYAEGAYVYELGIDPGMKTWNATVRRNIATGKEVGE